MLFVQSVLLPSMLTLNQRTIILTQSVLSRQLHRIHARFLYNTRLVSRQIWRLSSTLRLVIIFPLSKIVLMHWGLTYNGHPVGTLGTAAFFSSQWSKPYTTGLGGIAVTADPVIGGRVQTIQNTFVLPPIQRLWQLRLQFMLYQRFFSPQVYWFAMEILHRLSSLNLFVGSSSNRELTGAIPLDMSWKMSPFQCRVGMAELHTLAQKQIRRKELTAIYLETLEKYGLPSPPSAMKHTSCICVSLYE